VLFLGTLLHDVGKAFGGEGHTERGVEMAETILTRLGISEGDRADVKQLIQNHLCMYEVATRRDLEDPRSLRELCAAVRGREPLRELYLLTIADVTTTNPTSMTNWKRRMLDELFLAAERALMGDQSLVSPRIAAVRARVLELWRAREDRVFIEHFSSGLPERYFYSNQPEAIVEHARFAASAESRPASIRQGSVSHPYFELWVVADDRPGLLARITCMLSHAKLKVRSAQVYSWIGRDGRSRSLDIFWVRGPEDEERAQRLMPRLTRELEGLLSRPAAPGELERHALAGARTSRRLKVHVPTEVHVDNESAANHTIVEVIAQDRPALLFTLSYALQQEGLSIWFAKINTEGERVVDVFYLSGPTGQKVTDGAAIAGIRHAIANAVASLEVQTSGPTVAAATASDLTV